jgi:hypothetical protein
LNHHYLMDTLFKPMKYFHPTPHKTLFIYNRVVRVYYNNYLIERPVY